MGSAFSAMGSSAAADGNSKDEGLSYGCWNCDTLLRQVEELHAEVASLKAAGLSSAAASGSCRVVSPDVEKDGEVRDCSPSPSNSDDDAERTARPDSRPAADHVNNDNAQDQQTARMQNGGSYDGGQYRTTEVEVELPLMEACDGKARFEEMKGDEYSPQQQQQPILTTSTTNAAQQHRQQSYSQRHLSASPSTHLALTSAGQREHHQQLPDDSTRRCVWIQSHYQLSRMDLTELMCHFGTVERVDVPVPRPGGMPFAFVYFEHADDAQYVLEVARRGEFECMTVKPFHVRKSNTCAK